MCKSVHNETHKNLFGTQRKRSRRCGECIGCKSKNCQKCSACQDMTKYGGPGKKKQCCINRQCIGRGLYKPIRMQNSMCTYFPKVGQEFLSARTFFPRKACPVGQNFLG